MSKKVKKKKHKISLKRYEKFVTELASPMSMSDDRAKLTMGALGLVGEAGEFADLAKKILFHNLEYTEEVRQKLLLELSDIMWYVSFTARNVLGVGIQEVIEANVEKLSARYKTGKFSKKEFLEKESKKVIGNRYDG